MRGKPHILAGLFADRYTLAHESRHLTIEPHRVECGALESCWRQPVGEYEELKVNSESEAEGTMPLLVKTRKTKRRRFYRHRVRVLWLAVIVLGLMMLLGAILLASMKDYDWLF